MKAIHKRVPSGIQNSSLFQNTQRIQHPKRSIELRDTAKKQNSDQDMFNRILRETEIYQLYDAFVQFHVDMESFLKEGSIEQMRNCCYQFKDLLADLCTEHNEQANQMLREEQAEKIRELLQQIYSLRKKVTDLDRSLQFNSISSLEQFTNAYVSQKKTTTLNKQLFSQAHPSVSRRAQGLTDQDIDFNTVNQPIANLIQLKMITFDLLSSYWKCISYVLPDQASLLLQQIKSAYRQQFNFTHYNNRQMTNSMDTIQKLNYIAKMFTKKLQQTYQNNDKSMCT